MGTLLSEDMDMLHEKALKQEANRGAGKMDFEEMLKYRPYELSADQKAKILNDRLNDLTKLHRTQCQEYFNILECTVNEKLRQDSYEDLPFLPVRLFKELSLKSVPEEEVVKTMTSSGTTGQAVSMIFLDRKTSINQQKAMVKIVSDFTGSSRMPMIIIDCPSVVKDRKSFSARGAGVLGFSILGSAKMYALDDDMNLNWPELKEFIEKYRGKKIFLFGFTFMIWQYFYKSLAKIKAETGEQVDLSNAMMIHGGGWKKLSLEAVSFEEFRDRMTEVCGLSDIHDYYGMVEQTGCIYMQCECGHLHASIFSDVIIRDPKDFSRCPNGKKGIIQVVSAIPESYPGHSLLTEDEGVVLGEDDCPCGRKGKYFQVLGRVEHAEIRGCSDTYAIEYSAKLLSAENMVSDQICQKLSYLAGDFNTVEKMKGVSPLIPFSEEVMAFMDDLSRELLEDKRAKAYADVVSLGFWLRKSSINGLKKKYLEAEEENIRVGRGLAFHIAPSNVPVNFAYSLFTGLLMGNANVVRVPSKEFPQVTLVVQLLKKVLKAYVDLQPYIALVQYDRNADVNIWLSSICDVRIIWGGDATVERIRSIKLPPRATEITFADRYSLAVIDSDFYMECKGKKKLARDFYNETYLSDQNACTSPQVVVWHGSKKEEAKREFWSNLCTIVQERYQLGACQSVDKLKTACMVAAKEAGKIGMLKVLPHEDNLLIRLQVDILAAELMKYRGNSGFFYEYDCSDLMELRDFCNNTKCQTLGYIGIAEQFKPLLFSGLKGLDRVVPVGHMMDFDFIWDGYNLYDSMTRAVAIR